MEAIAHHVKSFVNVSRYTWPNDNLIRIYRFENVVRNVSEPIDEWICQVWIFEVAFVDVWI